MSLKKDFNDVVPNYDYESLLWNALVWVRGCSFFPEDKERLKTARNTLFEVIRSGADVNQLGYKQFGDRDAYEYSPFEFAVLCMGDLAIANELRAHGAQLNRLDVYGNTLAHNIVYYPQPLSLLEFLIDKGADMSIRNGKGMDVAELLNKRISNIPHNPYETEIGKQQREDYISHAQAILKRLHAPKPPKPGL